MTSATPDLADDLTAAMTRWLQQADPLLGPMPTPVTGEDVVATLGDDRVLGIARVARTPVDEPLAVWSASTVDQLQLRFVEDANETEIGAVLDAWLALPAAGTAPDGDHARSLRLPVVARSAFVPLLERGFAPATTTLVRRVRPEDAGQRASIVPTGVRIRSARPGDRDAMCALMAELLETEVAFGVVRRRRPGLGDHYVTEALRMPPGSVVVAESDDGPIGWASLTPPSMTAWAAASVAVGPLGYLGIMTVTSAHRSVGVGRAIVAELHARAADDGVAVTSLDASVLNSWSIPFWHRSGYRPLWTTWQRRTPR